VVLQLTPKEESPSPVTNTFVLSEPYIDPEVLAKQETPSPYIPPSPEPGVVMPGATPEITPHPDSPIYTVSKTPFTPTPSPEERIVSPIIGEEQVNNLNDPTTPNAEDTPVNTNSDNNDDFGKTPSPIVVKKIENN
jgi:hypothetical protein